MVEEHGGFDLDGDGTPDNALGTNPLFRLGVNETLPESIRSATFLMALELNGRLEPDESGHLCVTLTLWKVRDTDADPSDNFTGQEAFAYDPLSLDEAGVPRAAFVDVTDDMREIEGQADTVVLPLPMGRQTLLLTLRLARISGIYDRAMGTFTQGELGGAIDGDVLFAQLSGAGVEPPQGYTWEDLFGQPDVDYDQDGTPEAYSVAFEFSGVGARITDGQGPGECNQGEVRVCECPDGSPGEQECEQGRWLPCRCEGGCSMHLPDLETFGPTGVVDRLQVSDAGSGFDLDGDGDVDNALGANQLFRSSVNDTVPRSIREGRLLLGIELSGELAPRDPCVTLTIWKLLDLDDDPSDNFSGRERFTFDPVSLDERGVPRAVFVDVTRDLRSIDGQADTVVLPLPMGQELLLLTMHRARITGEYDPDGRITLGGFILGGAVDRDDLLHQLEAAGVNPPPGFDWDRLLGGPDIDSDGDGTPDSYSVAFEFSGVGAELVPGPEPVPVSKPAR